MLIKRLLDWTCCLVFFHPLDPRIHTVDHLSQFSCLLVSILFPAFMFVHSVRRCLGSSTLPGSSKTLRVWKLLLKYNFKNIHPFNPKIVRDGITIETYPSVTVVSSSARHNMWGPLWVLYKCSNCHVSVTRKSAIFSYYVLKVTFFHFVTY